MLSTRRRAQLGLVAAFVVLAASVTTLVVAPRLSTPVAVADVGTVAPDFQLPDTSGVKFSLSDCRGHVVVLLFSAPGSSQNPANDPALQNFARDYDADQRVKFVSIDVLPNQSTDSALMLPNLPDFGHNFSRLLDNQAAVASRYSAMETPTVVVVDSRGMVRYRGPMDDKADLASVSHNLLADMLHDVLGNSHIAVASK